MELSARAKKILAATKEDLDKLKGDEREKVLAERASYFENFSLGDNPWREGQYQSMNTRSEDYGCNVVGDFNNPNLPRFIEPVTMQVYKPSEVKKWPTFKADKGL